MDLRIMNGNIVKECISEYATKINKYGFASYKEDEKWGVINSKGEIVIEPFIELEIKEPQFIGRYILIETENEKYCVADTDV